MDERSYSRLLSFAVCELTMPVKKHVVNYIMNDLTPLNHHLLSSASSGALKSQCKKFVQPSPNIYLKRPRPISEDESILKRRKIAKKNSSSQSIVYETEEMISDSENDSKPCKQIGLSHIEQSSIKITSLVSDNECNPTDIPNDCICERTSPNGQAGDVILKSTEGTHNLNVCDNSEEDIASENLQQTSIVDLSFGPHNVDNGFDSDPLLLCSETDFIMMFRMTRPTFQNLLAFFSKEEMETIENVPLYKKVLIVLWLMGNSGSYSDAAQVFSVTEEAVANCFLDVCATLYNKSESFIRWPNSDECNEIALRIEKKYGFPDVVGILGCEYFSTCIPKEAFSRREHFNAKLRTYCIALQIVCDDKLLIRDISPGLPGGTPQAKVLRDSTLGEQLTSGSQQLIEPNKHILARSEYPQLKSMLTPYSKSAEELGNDELEFNKLHENVCQLVNKTFQMLKDRFVTLKMLDPEVATMVLVAACVLHNICLENNDIFETKANTTVL